MTHFLQFLFNLEGLSFTFIYKLDFCWVQYSKLMVFFFQDFDYVSPFSPNL